MFRYQTKSGYESFLKTGDVFVLGNRLNKSGVSYKVKLIDVLCKIMLCKPVFTIKKEVNAESERT